MQERSLQEASGVRWNREEIARKLSEYTASAGGVGPGPSQRTICQELRVPRSTLQYRLTRQGSLDEAPEVIAFFESPAGVRFLHRLVVGAQFVMNLEGNCGIRLVCQYLELTGLAHFVASSYGSQQQVSQVMEEQVVAFGHMEKVRLGSQMSRKTITVCEDENFHSDVCLVGIEPVSNFILLEEYAANRSAATWTEKLARAIEGLPVDVIQGTSDEAKGICAHVSTDLGAHHSPDLFHIQQELVKGTSVALAGRVTHAEQMVSRSVKAVTRHQTAKADDERGPRRPGRPVDFDTRIQQAQAQESQARVQLETALSRQQRVKKAIHGIRADYHPYDVESGQPKSSEQVSAELTQHFAEVVEVAQEAGLPERCRQKIRKAKRMVTQMVATIAFVVLSVTAKIEALRLTPKQEKAMLTQLIPALYLKRLAAQAQTADTRHTFHDKAEQLLAPLMARNGPFSQLNNEDLAVVEQVAQECAHLFQRSSSCVEGRNGVLALRHHHLHRIRSRRLAALTTIHNYVATRHDGTTAAERFFGAPPKDVFEWLLDRVDLPGRPAQKRSQAKKKKSLLQAAT